MSSYQADDLIKADKNKVWHHITQHKLYDSVEPMVFVEGNGMRITDARGNTYLDAVSGGVWTVNVGYGRERIAKAVYEQLKTLNYFSGAIGTVPGAVFAEKLLDKMPGLNRVYYSNSGSEANEKAYKMVRQLAYKQGTKKNKIVFRKRDYHGTTITALSSTGQPQRRAQYGPFTPGFVEIPDCCEYRSCYGDIENYGVEAAKELEKVIQKEDPDTIGSVVLEPVTAGGGVILPPEGYFETIQEICRKYGVLLHIDEVVCGVGRTGKWFGYQHFGVEPDIVTMAKGVASGYAAISCTVTTEELFKAFKEDETDDLDYFRDISTFGGCTAGPAAAIANMEIIEEENLLENCTEMGKYLLGRLNELKDKYEMVGDVRGLGLFAGAELVKDRQTKEPVSEKTVADIVGHCKQQGVLIGRTTRAFETNNNVLTLSPAIIATIEDIDEIVNAMDKAIAANT